MTLSCVWRWIVTASCLALLTISLACTQGKSTDDSPGAISHSSRGASAFTPSNDPRKDLRDALEKLNSAYPYRLTEVSSGSANGKEVPQGTRVVEFAAKDQSHAKWTAGPLGDTEVITI